jgi:ABC-type multidrug transport system permease subunit
MYPLNPLTRIISGMVSTELDGLEVRCIARELVSFIPPSGQTCQQWAGEFVTAAGGYLVDGNATDICDYCQYAVGNQFFEPLQIFYDDRWRDWGILLAFVISNSLIAIAASKYIVSSLLASFELCSCTKNFDVDALLGWNRIIQNDRDRSKMYILGLKCMEAIDA